METSKTTTAFATSTGIATSSDGTPIAYERIGDGPPLILVDGAMCFRSFGPSVPLARLLASDRTVYCYDRRGRGESGDAREHSVEREIEDIDALIATAGGSASLYGISSGGALSLEAAARLGGKVEKLALYEIPYDASEEGIRAWHGYRATLTDLLSTGQRGEAVALFMRFVGASDDGVDGMRRAPVWATFEQVAPTLAYDAAALGADRTVPAERAACVTATTLVMDGGASLEHLPFMRRTAEVLTRVIRNARHQVLEGQGHDIDPQVLAPVLADFLR